jgi:hypothetical protein
MAIRMGAIPLSILESQFRMDQLNAAYGEALDTADYGSACSRRIAITASLRGRITTRISP